MQLDIFKNKKILVIVPHPDDEINLAGALIASANNIAESIHIAVMTNGDYYGMYSRRLMEVDGSIRKLGIVSENLIYLGYPEADFASADFEGGKNIISYRGLKHTYALKEKPEYHWLKTGEHALINYKNIKSDIEALISDIQPDIIVYNGNDKHEAHILLCNIVEAIIKESPQIVGLALKGFCYETAWKAPRDYYAQNILSCCRGNMTNIYDKEWGQRMRFPVDKTCRSRVIWNNKIYKALNEHASQIATINAKSIINSDFCYWISARNIDIQPYIKLCFKEDFVYDLKIKRDVELKEILVYEYDGEKSRIRPLNEFIVKTSGDIVYEKGELKWKGKRRKGKIFVETKDGKSDDNIGIELISSYKSIINKCYRNLEKIIDKIWFITYRKMYRYFLKAYCIKKENLDDKTNYNM
ncbi:PIG-L family deacetylase [Eubacterium ventriosum]|uniref:PIG-L family deacetylase n=1 Tax=Eubacterium ventriosum TaxID=39496 RepID=A0A415LHU6_9FIRM|nr:PIG-L family deacetylase [Eubacterium ventriosum]RHL48116.1 PIG-L family deacetylase [Eubacterium ventriosum]